MTCLPTPLVQRIFALAGTAALAAAAAACSPAQASDVPDVAVSQQELDFKDIAAQCGLACPGDENDKGVEIKGITEGNAAISGVGSVDAFFGQVINFQNAAGGVSAGIKAQLDAIRGDFGIDAKADLAAALKTQFEANLEGGVEFKAEPPKCEADVKATLEAKARCEGEVNPGMVSVDCKGSCEVDASVEAKCDASADLQCTVRAPSVMCMGSCQGSCTTELKAKAACTGTCRGSCDGSCSAYVKNAQGQAECAGQCNGMCQGSCEAEFAAAAECKGSCNGECTVTNPEAGCKGAVRAECKGKADASVKCEGKCQGEFEPPSAKVECQASAKADAKINVQCTPPRVGISYKLKAAGTAQADIMARAKFEAALKVLVSTRLPALKASLAKADSVADAGADLVSAAGGALEGAFKTAASGKVSVRVQFGLGCAVLELPKVKTVIDKSTTNLKTQIEAATKVTSMLKV
jgi:hypothetical protein